MQKNRHILPEQQDFNHPEAWLYMSIGGGRRISITCRLSVTVHHLSPESQRRTTPRYRFKVSGALLPPMGYPRPIKNRLLASLPIPVTSERRRVLSYRLSVTVHFIGAGSPRHFGRLFLSYNFFRFCSVLAHTVIQNLKFVFVLSQTLACPGGYPADSDASQILMKYSRAFPS